MNIAIVGASGGIGSALLNRISSNKSDTVYAFSRSVPELRLPNIIYHKLEFELEASIADAAKLVRESGPLDRVIVCTGVLHNSDQMPEKSFKALNPNQLMHNYFVNVVGPALVAKHFLPEMRPSSPSIFAVLSARVGSISDNRLGGWHAYRSSKAALNMLVKNLSIEMARKNDAAIVVALHPGTVDTNLSSPFKNRVPKDSLFSPETAAEHLLSVLDRLESQDSGKIYAWDGKEILP